MGNEKMTLDSLKIAPARAMKVAKRELMAKATVWHGEEAPPHVALLMPVLGFTRTDVFSDNAITPDGSEVESVGSALVATVMEPPRVDVLLMVRPDSVTVTAVPAARVAVEVVMTMDVRPGAPGLREAPPDTAPVGMGPVAKKLLG